MGYSWRDTLQQMDDRRWVIEGEERELTLEELQARFRNMPLGDTKVRLASSTVYLSQANMDAILAEPIGGAFSQPPQQPTYANPPYQSVTPPNEDPMRFVVPVNPSGWAIASGYLGLFSTTCVFAPFAIITAILAFRDIKRDPNKTGIGRAWFGLIMGCIFTIVLLIIVVMSIISPPKSTG